MILPAGDADAAAFWLALDEGTLLVSVCRACNNRWLPPLSTTDARLRRFLESYDWPVDDGPAAGPR